MKATFEAAEQTGRKVYYHFEGSPPNRLLTNYMNTAKDME